MAYLKHTKMLIAALLLIKQLKYGNILWYSHTIVYYMSIGRYTLLLLETNMQKSAQIVGVQLAEVLPCEHTWETNIGSNLSV